MQKSTMPYRRMAAAALAATLLAACADPVPTGPVGARLSTPGQAPAHDVAPASVEWNEIARAVIMRNRSNVFVAFRTYGLVSVAQERALEAIADAPTTDGHPSLRAAIASASVAVLGSLFPNEATWLATQYQARIESGDSRNQVRALTSEAPPGAVPLLHHTPGSGAGIEPVHGSV